MELYRIKIKPKSSYITPWQSDTIFGSLCWVIANYEGEKVLKEFLQGYRQNNVPFVVSNGFINDLLPKPVARKISLEDMKGSKSDILKHMQLEKQNKKIDWLTIDEFNSIINNREVIIKSKENKEKQTRTMHNSISRFSDATIEGSLYEQNEYFLDEGHISIYVKVKDEYKDKLFDLFKRLSITGFGKKISTGKGQFSIQEIEKFQGFKIPDKVNCFVNLSNYVPKEEDPTRGQYKTFIKHPKLGQGYALSANPFKRPVLMIKPGAVFWTTEVKDYYGRLVSNISYEHPQVVQCGYSLSIPAYIEEIDLN
ncbi:MAG: hypothetical protein N4A57_03075 [Anaeromicrobium sp.]|jgi:CRISPR-associated protein Csm4|uniref:type III-A CRISPR-associated RAMP protein Csm4 n=1 Tax=Anaeromicrobium sp. TaxID=1929132 RepID=UPI0025E28256|nr:hypothetical protein [Anaeromicrobium sp.]MCT4593243.1 hypothetical protein [Anaeromicrobium sp.]